MTKKPLVTKNPKTSVFDHIKVYFFSHMLSEEASNQGWRHPALLGPQKTNLHLLGSTILSRWLPKPC